MTSRDDLSAGSHGTCARGIARVLLRLAVHRDAAMAHPCAWLRAAWWRVLGKRLRSRAQMAPLLGTSPRAYRLWLDTENRKAPPLPDEPDEARKGAAILALVPEGAGIETTLASLLREGIEACRIPVRSVPTPADLVMADGSAPDWLLPLASGDAIARGAGAVYRRAARQAAPGVQLLYGDDDLAGADSARYDPHFKPDWNAELFDHHDFLSGAALLRTNAEDLADLKPEDWAGSLTGRAVRRSHESGAEPMHLRRILHHRRSRPSPRLPVPELASPASGAWPGVSVIVPTRNRVDLLRTCLEGLAATRYAGRLEILVIDNGSDDPATLDYLAALDPAFARILPHPGPFNFAAMNNRALEGASGDLVCFLNNDIEMRDPDWLSIMAQQALRPDVGAVGARLLYPDGRIQHAGVVIGIGGGAAHAHRLLDPGDKGYFARHSLPQFVSAVTAACLVARRDKIMAVGGFDADNFAVAFNDVDLCLKLNAQGWQSFYEPRATLIHHESVSRGFDRDPAGAARLAGELAALKARWGTGGADGKVAGPGEAVDPFHHPCLSPYSERFVVRL